MHWPALFFLVISTTSTLAVHDVTQKEFISVVEFKTLPFGFPTPADHKEALQNGFYNESIVTRPYGFAVYKNLVFITIPRLDVRTNYPVPYSLAIVGEKQTENGPELKAFPNYEVHKYNNKNHCDNKIVSVFRPNVDECGQLWVIDTGKIGLEQVCPPKIMALDPISGKILHRYTFPEKTYIPSQSTLSNFILSNNGYLSCRKNMFYINDPRGYRFIVYNQGTGRSWHIEHNTFGPEEDHINVSVNGTLFTFEDGLYQINLNKTHVIYHPHASLSEYALPLSLVNDESVWSHNPSAVPCAVTHLGVRSVQWSASAIDSTGIMYGCYTTPSAIHKWDTSEHYTAENQVLVARNDETLQYCSNVKIVRNDFFAMTTRLQKANTGGYNVSEINFRVLKCSMEGLRSGGDC